MIWQHGDWSSTEEKPAYYEVYDGKKLIATIDGKSADDLHRARIPLSAPGKRRLTVRACSRDKKTRGKTSAVYPFTTADGEQQFCSDPIFARYHTEGSGDYTYESVTLKR